MSLFSNTHRKQKLRTQVDRKLLAMEKVYGKKPIIGSRKNFKNHTESLNKRNKPQLTVDTLLQFLSTFVAGTFLFLLMQTIISGTTPDISADNLKNNSRPVAFTDFNRITPNSQENNRFLNITEEMLMSQVETSNNLQPEDNSSSQSSSKDESSNEIEELENPKPTQDVSKNLNYYTVLENDTLYGISLKLNISLKKLAEANNLSDPYPLSIGQKLIIPEL